MQPSGGGRPTEGPIQRNGGQRPDGHGRNGRGVAVVVVAVVVAVWRRRGGQAEQAGGAAAAGVVAGKGRRVLQGGLRRRAHI